MRISSLICHVQYWKCPWCYLQLTWRWLPLFGIKMRVKYLEFMKSLYWTLLYIYIFSMRTGCLFPQVDMSLIQIWNFCLFCRNNIIKKQKFRKSKCRPILLSYFLRFLLRHVWIKIFTIFFQHIDTMSIQLIHRCSSRNGLHFYLFWLSISKSSFFNMLISGTSSVECL